MELTDKEKKLLEDLLQIEYLCMHKYQVFTTQAVDPQIKNIFNMAYQQEVRHANTIKSLLQQGGFQPPQDQS